MKNHFILDPSMKTESDPRLIFALMQVGPKKKMYGKFIDNSEK
jgi:hypothetical protein